MIFPKRSRSCRAKSSASFRQRNVKYDFFSDCAPNESKIFSRGIRVKSRPSLKYDRNLRNPSEVAHRNESQSFRSIATDVTADRDAIINEDIKIIALFRFPIGV